MVRAGARSLQLVCAGGVHHSASGILMEEIEKKSPKIVPVLQKPLNEGTVETEAVRRLRSKKGAVQHLMCQVRADRGAPAVEKMAIYPGLCL